MGECLHNLLHLQPLSVQILSSLGTLVQKVEGKYKCIARGWPTPFITWRYNGNRITTMLDEYRIKSKAYGERAESDLILMSTNSSGSGVLQCTARNKHGSDVSRMKVTIVTG